MISNKVVDSLITGLENISKWEHVERGLIYNPVFTDSCGYRDNSTGLVFELGLNSVHFDGVELPSVIVGAFRKMIEAKRENSVRHTLWVLEDYYGH